MAHTLTVKSIQPHIPQFDGLSLRDFFAAKAMQTLMTDPWYRNSNRKIKQLGPDLASDAYDMADAMLCARDAASSPAETMRAHLDTFGEPAK